MTFEEFVFLHVIHSFFDAAGGHEMLAKNDPYRCYLRLRRVTIPLLGREHRYQLIPLATNPVGQLICLTTLSGSKSEGVHLHRDAVVVRC